MRFLQKHLIISIFVFFLSLYILSMNGYIGNTDGETMYLVTKSLVEDHNVSIEPEVLRKLNGRYGMDGKFYSQYGIGQSLIALPFYIAGSWVANRFSHIDKKYITRFFVLLLTPLITALTCTLFFVFSRSLEFSLGNSIFLTFSYGLGTMAWPYSKYFYSEPLITFLLTFSIYSLYRFGKEKQNIIWIFLSSISIGLAVLTKLITLIVLPFLIIYLSILLRRKNFKSTLKVLSIFFFPILGFFLIVIYYNFIRFGSIFKLGYEGEGFSTSLYVGLYGLLLSPGKSLFLCNPILLLSFWSWKRFFKSYRIEALLFFGISFVFLLVVSLWHDWDGGVCWGPRYLIPIAPLLLLPVGILLEDKHLKDLRFFKIILASLLIIAIFVQLLPVLIKYDTYLSKVGDLTLTNFNPIYMPIIGQWKNLMRADFSKFNTESLAKIDIHNDNFKSNFERSLDLWYIYLYRLGLPLKFSLASLIFVFLMIVSGISVSRSQYRANQKQMNKLV